MFRKLSFTDIRICIMIGIKTHNIITMWSCLLILQHGGRGLHQHAACHPTVGVLLVEVTYIVCIDIFQMI